MYLPDPHEFKNNGGMMPPPIEKLDELPEFCRKMRELYHVQCYLTCVDGDEIQLIFAPIGTEH